MTEYISPQYAYRAQKTLGLVNGHPSYESAGLTPSDPTSAKIYRYSPTGSLLAYVLSSTVHIIPTPYLSTSSPSSSSTLSPSSSSSSSSFTIPSPITLDIPGVIDLAFSPLGRYLFTWERLGKVEEGQSAPRNLRCFYLGGGGGGEAVEVGGFTQKGYDQWQPLLTPSESHLIRLSSPTELSIFTLPTTPPTLPSTTSSSSSSVSDLKSKSELFGLDKPTHKFRSDSSSPIRGLFISHTNPGSNTSVSSGKVGLALWFGENKGIPGSIALYTLSQLFSSSAPNQGFPSPAARKSFFKGDKVTLKWNQDAKQVLFLTTSDVDNSGKSYYGETGLYSLGLEGGLESKVQLDKEGPIYDFAWNPNSREFGVVYGFMPAKTVLFDIKANPIHSFGPQPRNFLLYQPQGRLFLSAGFGNLTGTIDIFDLRTRKKLCEFRAPNSTSCEWSPCGRFILTGTLSPRLRVDNGLKVWWCTGGLMHAQAIEELYQVSWRPGPTSAFPAFPTEIPAPPTPNASAAAFAPPEASATPKPTGAYRPPGARGTLTPTIFKREDEGGAPSLPSLPSTNGSFSPSPANGRGKRTIPGAPPPGAGPSDAQANGKQGKKGKKGSQGANGTSAPGTPVVEQPPSSPAPVDAAGDAESEAIQKKIRNLNKKLKAITELKDKQKKGETLEATQIKKIEGEKAILQELSGLEASLK